MYWFKYHRYGPLTWIILIRAGLHSARNVKQILFRARLVSPLTTVCTGSCLYNSTSPTSREHLWRSWMDIRKNNGDLFRVVDEWYNGSRFRGEIWSLSNIPLKSAFWCSLPESVRSKGRPDSCSIICWRRIFVHLLHHLLAVCSGLPGLQAVSMFCLRMCHTWVRKAFNYHIRWKGNQNNSLCRGTFHYKRLLRLSTSMDMVM